MSGLKIGMIAAGLFSLLFLGGAGCSFGAWQQSKIGASERFSQYGSFGRGIGASLDQRYQQRAYVGFGVGTFFGLIGLALIGGSFFVGGKKQGPQVQAAWPQQPLQQGWQPPGGGQGGAG